MPDVRLLFYVISDSKDQGIDDWDFPTINRGPGDGGGYLRRVCLLFGGESARTYVLRLHHPASGGAARALRRLAPAGHVVVTGRDRCNLAGNRAFRGSGCAPYIWEPVGL